MRRATRSTSGGSRALLNRSSLEENLKKLKIARLKKAAREAALKNASEAKNDRVDRNSRVIKKEEPDEAPEEYATPRQSTRKKNKNTEELVEKHAAKKNIDQDVLNVVRRSTRRTPREEEHRKDIDEQKEPQKDLLPNPAVDDTIPTESISNESILSISSSSFSQSPKRSFRIKKEVSICGVTCTCCVHTSLQRLKKKREPQTPSKTPETPSKPSKSSVTPATPTSTPTSISIQKEKTPDQMLSTKNPPRRNSSRARKPSVKTLEFEEPIESERNARGRSSTRARRPSVRTFELEEPKESERKTRGRSSSRPRKPSAKMERKKLDLVVKTEPEPSNASISPPPLLQREDMLAQEPIQEVIVKEEIEDEAESVASKTRRPSKEDDIVLEDVYDIENEMRAVKESRETTPCRKPIKSKERRRVVVEESSMSEQSELTSEDDVKPDTVAEVRRRRKKIGKSRLLTRLPKKAVRREKEIPSEDIFLQQNLGFGGIDKEAVLKEYEEVLEEEFVEMFSVSHKKTANVLEKLASSEQNIEYVVLGGVFHMKTWYRGSYPCEYSLLSCIHICDGCFGYFRTAKICSNHMVRCEMRGNPPGNEIYKDVSNNVSVFQVDGEKFPGYCSNLCLLTMLWLRDKIVYADVHPFFFYVVTNTSKGYYRTVGYFSKQKFTTHPQNLSCMCVFPCYQGNRLGSFIVDFSYLLSRLEDLPGGPEHPLSTLGELTYRKYWKETLMRYFYVAVQDATKRGEDVLNLEDIIKATGMRAEDIADTIGMMFRTTKTKKEKNTFTLTWDRELVMREGARLEKEYHQKLFAKEKYVSPKFVDEIEARKSCKWSWPSTCVEVMRRSESDSDSDSE